MGDYLRYDWACETPPNYRPAREPARMTPEEVALRNAILDLRLARMMAKYPQPPEIACYGVNELFRGMTRAEYRSHRARHLWAAYRKFRAARAALRSTMENHHERT